MQFKVTENKKCFKGELAYLKEEHSFDYIPRMSADILIMIKYLTLGFDSGDMRAKQLYGYSPFIAWIPRSLIVPVFFKGSLILEEGVVPGIPERLPEAAEWNTYYDVNNGWVCIGKCDFEGNYDAVEFLDSVGVVLSRGKIEALWLKPNVKIQEGGK